MARYKELLAQNLTAPMKMEIVVADADGKGARTVTNFGCASFAPTFTPDGKKILFASNKNDCDSRKFELFLMNLGRQRPGAGDRFRRLHLIPGILAGRQAPGLLLGPRRQRALRIQHLHGRLEVVSPPEVCTGPPAPPRSSSASGPAS